MSTFKELVKTIAQAELEFPQLRAISLAQSIMEAGEGTSKLFLDFNNAFGMKWRKEMEGLARPIIYKTNSEPSGQGTFCGFDSVADGYKGYWKFLERSPYRGWKQHTSTPEAFIAFIGPIWCPPGYAKEWAAKRGGLNYHEYIISHLLPRAQKFLAETQVSKVIATVNGESFLDKEALMRSIDSNLAKGLTAISMQAQKEEEETQAPIKTSKAVELWIPYAQRFPQRMVARGTYRKGYPEFALVHFTAGRPGTGVVRYAVGKGLNFLTIIEDGTVVQCNPLNEWGSHAGVSSKEGFGTSVSRFCCGIEITNAGKVTEVVVDGVKKYKAWYHKNPSEFLSASEVRYNPGTKEKISKGWYHKYTPAQEDALIKLLAWLYMNNPKVFRLDLTTGHENVAKPHGRKNDPGGSLSMTMTELIQKAQDLVKASS
jgi:hypothetical protein